MTRSRGFRDDEHPEELLSASLTGDLTAAERATMDEHLAACEQCRSTLAAFGEERHLLAGLRQVDAPRDLGARVRAGIEDRRRDAVAWWRRPSTLVAAFASVATVAAAVLAVIVISNIPRGPIGATQGASPSSSLLASAEPSRSPAASAEPSAVPTTDPMVALNPGELGYLSLEGEAMAPSRLYFVNDDTGRAVQAETPSGPPTAASISPTGEWLAYITEVGQAGFNQVWVLHLADGGAQVLGCSLPNPFTDRLVWSDDGRFLAYTLAEINPGGALDCGGAEGDGTQTNVWLFDGAASGEHVRLTDAGNAFAGDFLATLDDAGGYTLLVSYAAEQPYTQATSIPPAQSDPDPIEAVFMPLLSPEGDRALFWRGQMARAADGAWRLSRGGMAYLSGEPIDGQPSWSGEPLFADLELPGGAGFESGQFAWGADGDLVAFWHGEWTGSPQDDTGTYPSTAAIYVGRLSGGLLTKESRLALDLADLQRVVAVALDPDGVAATVTVGQASAGVGQPPSAYLLRVPFDGGEPQQVGEGLDPPPWNGPSVYGGEAVALSD